MEINQKIEAILKDLKSPVWQQRDQALKRLWNLKDKAFIEPLFEAVKLESVFIQRQYCRFLGNFGHPDGIIYLLTFLKSGIDELRREAGLALDKIPDERKYDELLALLDTSNDFVQGYAIEALGKGMQINAVTRIIDMLYSPNTDLRVKAINALRLIGDKRAVKGILPLLDENEDILIICSAIFALVDLDKRKLGKHLKKLLWHKSPLVCKVAVWAIGEMGDAKNIQMLSDRLVCEPDERLIQEASRSFIKLGAKKPLAALASETKNVCITCLSNVLNNADKQTDICIIVEGSYPYVKGGVADWVHKLIKSLPEYKFYVQHIASFQSDFREFKYDLPSNLTGIGEMYIHEGKVSENGRDYDRNAWNVLEKLLGRLSANQSGPIENNDFDRLLDCALKIPDKKLLYSQELWNLLVALYRNKMPANVSFTDYFWTYRSIILPLLQLRRQPLPPARIYHALSTGYSGLVGAIAKANHQGSLVLTEHGIYHRERRLEIERLPWIHTDKQRQITVGTSLGALKDIWLGFFNTLSRITYYYSDKVITLYDDNRSCQIEMGAAPDKTMIIPNGIEVEKFMALKSASRQTAAARKKPFTIGLAGRVVPIKDVKTFIRAAKIVLENVPASEFLVMGSLEEDPEYAAECIEFARLLELDEKLKFTDDVYLPDYYPDIDVLALTSISESQPLVILEAMACGIPVVANNVGSCHELVFGNTKEDIEIGPAGIISYSSSPTEIAAGIISIFKSPDLRTAMAQAGQKRVAKYYRQEQVIETYRNLYRQLITV